VVSNPTVSEGHTIGKLLAVAYAESFHAVMASGWFWRGRLRVATAATTPF
jgi:hypothetical protein